MGPDFQVVSESLTHAVNMVKGFMALKSEAERQQFVIDMQAKLLEAQQKALWAAGYSQELFAQNIKLDEEVMSLLDRKEFIATMKRQEGFLYAPEDADPYCSRCAEVDVKAVHLVLQKEHHLRRPIYRCPQCKTEYVKMV